VNAQCSSGTYDLDCNLAVLKLYQFHPEKNNVDTVAKILVKALMQQPATDYLMCTYLIPERVQETEVVSNIAAVAALLETCAFRQVWPALEPLQSGVLQAVPGFADAIRGFVLDTLQITYQGIPEAHVCASLNLDAAALPALLAERGWSSKDGIVSVPANDDNTAKPRKPDETGALRSDQMIKILSSTWLP